MASTTARSAHAERRANGAYPDKASARARMSGTDSQASDRYEQRYREGSPQINAAAFASTSHKRSASGNPRPTTRTTDERRTEKVQVTTRETLVSRTRSPDRRNSAAQRERTKATDGAKMRPPEPKVKDQKPEPAPQAPWEPIASLLPHTTAPLACRISLPPLASQAPQALQPKPLHELSLESQEAVILEDLLFVFMGFEGQYIRFSKTYNPHEERDRLSGPTFRILPGLDPSLQDLTQAMLKMASHYSALQAFVDVQSRDEFGSVNHALCASIRGFLQNYLNLVAQLETQFLTNDSFTLHVLNIHVLPTGQMLAQLYVVAHELMKKNALLDDESDDESTDDGDDYDKILDQLREGGELVPGNMAGNKICKGGVVLGLITKRLEDMAGDPSARALLTTLLRDASRPYMRMLNEWLHHGGIKDPHSEFLIKEQKSIRRERLEQDYTDEYWERRYTIRDHDIPPQLVGVKDKVLLAGKYLNVVRECGGVDVSKEVKDVPTSFDDARFLDNVNNAYAHANESLMQLLVTTHALPARLRSLKHYFFLDPSDYFSYFLELGASELRRNVKQVNIGKLQSLLDLVLRQPGTIVSMDPFKEDVKVEMNEVTLIKSLQRVVNITGIEQGETLQPVTNEPTEPDKHARGFTSLQLDYAVPFPVSLVISRKTIWRYQALFRYLLSLRHMESQLCAGWQHTMRSFSWTYKSSSARLQILKQRVWTLRARMLVFVQQLLYFCTAEVIEPNWQALMSRLDTKDGTSRTVDELMQDHVDFLDTCLKECMLTNSKLLKIYAKLMQTCHYFTNYLPWLTLEIEMACPELSRNERPANVSESQWRQFMLGRDERRKALENSNQGVNNPPGRSPDLVLDNLLDIFKKWEHQFGRHLQILLDALNHYAATETVVLLSLCARLSTANQGTEWAGRGHGDEDASAL